MRGTLEHRQNNVHTFSVATASTGTRVAWQSRVCPTAAKAQAQLNATALEIAAASLWLRASGGHGALKINRQREDFTVDGAGMILRHRVAITRRHRREGPAMMNGRAKPR